VVRLVFCSTLEDLSDYIGGRVTGSPQAAQAIEWASAG
jgi:hypothetical protein